MVSTIRGLTRPVLTLIGFGAMTYLALTGVLEPREYVPVVALMIGYWFGSRTTQPTNGS